MLDKIEQFINQNPLISALVLTSFGIVLLLYRILKPEFFNKEDNHDTVSGELNASYIGFAVILIVIGLTIFLNG